MDFVYPGLDSLVKLIRKKGRGCLLFKRDLWKCYCQIFMDPGSIHLLGFAVNQSLFFDVVLTMGLRIACYICQRIMNALMYTYRHLGHEGINYLDDLGGHQNKTPGQSGIPSAGDTAEKSRYLGSNGESVRSLHLHDLSQHRMQLSQFHTQDY